MASAFSSTMFRRVLKKIIFTAPDPNKTCGQFGFSPEYRAAWDDARTVLRLSCPNHFDMNGTCPNCHADTQPEQY